MFLLLAMTGCSHSPKVVKTVKKNNVDQAFLIPVKNISLNLDDPKTHKPIWKLTIGKASLNYQKDKQNYGSLENISGTFYEKGKPALSVSAKNGSYDELKHTVQLQGEVKGASFLNGFSLHADILEWQADQSRVIAKGTPLVIAGKNGFLLQSGMLIANTGLQTLKDY